MPPTSKPLDRAHIGARKALRIAPKSYEVEEVEGDPILLLR